MRWLAGLACPALTALTARLRPFTAMPGETIMHEGDASQEVFFLVRGTVELVECHNVLVDSDGPRVSAIGLDDIIIVVNGEDVLVTTRGGAQKVGKLTGALRQ